MKYLVRKYYSGFCTYEIEAKDEDHAFKITTELSPNYEEIIESLEDWEECNEIEPILCR